MTECEEESCDIYNFLTKSFHEHFDYTHSQEEEHCCGSDEVLPLIAGLLLESHKNRQFQEENHYSKCGSLNCAEKFSRKLWK